MHRLVFRSALLAVALCLCPPPPSQAATLQQQRDWFVQARQALDSNQMARFHRLKKRLAGYPLTPYLDIWQSWKQLGNGHDAEVAATLERYSNIPEANDLRKAWVEDLARRHQWHRIINEFHYHPRLRRKLPEIAMMADWKTGKRKAAMRHFSDRWVRTEKLSAISGSLHKAWLALGHPTASERWSRIIRLARHRRWKRVAALSSGMGVHQKHWLHYWKGLQGNPATAFTHWPASLSRYSGKHTKLVKAIIGDGMQRLARKDPLVAHATLQKLSRHLRPGRKDPFYATVERHIALIAARQHVPLAAQWLSQLPVAQQTMSTRAWAARLYMLQHDWKNTFKTVQTMPAAQRRKNRWQYWKAYALEASGDIRQSAPIFSRLASRRSYYGFLSAEHIGQSYRFHGESLDASPVLIHRLIRLPGIRRAHEWLALKNDKKAVREWYATLIGSNAKTWKAAAALAAVWNWPAQAIRAAYKAGALNALQTRFPLQYEQDVMRMARQTGLDPSTIWGVIRQESIFDRQALSPAGGRGLMQLLPGTARVVARKIGLHTNAQTLFSPGINIRLGARYLADLKSRFDDNLVLAAAAYNAGPNKVNRWLNRTPFGSPEIWVEAIPYNETRRYVQHVLAFAVVYQWRKKEQPTSLSELMNNPPRTVSMNVDNN